jgi:hypothetical protein
MPKLIGISGGLRKALFNTALLRAARELNAPDLGPGIPIAHVKVPDSANESMPL